MPVSKPFQNILVIGPNIGMGGVERASCNVANGLQSLGHKVTYLALIPEEPFFHLDAEYVEPKDFNENRMNFSKTLQFIRHHVKQIQPDTILSFTKFYAATANLALLGTRFGIVVSERSSPLYRWPFKIEFIARLSFWLKRPKAVISQTKIASHYHQKYYGKTQYYVIPNPVREIKKYPELKREKTILAVGRFHDHCKGFDLLVKAFNLVENSQWRLVFAGGTKAQGNYLLDLAKEDKKDRIEFLGVVRDMDRLYARAGIFTMPSRSEGFPNALAEAMSAGCCCVSFDFIAGASDMIRNRKNGVLVPPQDIEQLAKEIDCLIKDEASRITYQSEAVKTRQLLKQEVITRKYQAVLSE
ncbi:MAG TPA: glycosyltransferase [Saprospiraceae bacterium]|nr:glycosyltransferase [Saprospiraceae bacterium]